MKQILALWLAAMLVAVQPCYAVVCVGFGIGVACSDTPFISEEVQNSSLNFGLNDTYYYVGFVRTTSGSDTICGIGVFLNRSGTLTNSIYVEKWTTDSGTGALFSKQADLAVISPGAVDTAYSWIKVNFEPVTINQYEAIVFTFNYTTGGTYIRVGTNTSATTMNNYRSRRYSNVGAIDGTGTSVDVDVRLYGD